MATYDDAFFDYVNSGAVRSARAMLPLLTDELAIASVLDVGCGQGAWLSVWNELGVADITGIDGDYVDRGRLVIPSEKFVAGDLSSPFSLGRRFDVVQSLEVAEHLPTAQSRAFVSSLVAHSDIVLFSAAPRGQGGDHHINEQDYDFWRRLFHECGYLALDYLRPLVKSELQIEPWYRYNTLLYVARHRLESLPAALANTRLDDARPVPDVSPRLYQFRKRLISILPVPIMTALAKVKERVVSSMRRNATGTN